MKWQATRLDELGVLARGRSRHRPRDAAHLYGGPHPFVQTGDIKHAGLYVSEYSQSYSEAGLEQSKMWPKGTLCITIAANIGDTAILGFDACFPDSVIGFLADETKCDTRFIKYRFDTVKQQFQQVSQGAAQDNLSMEKLLALKIEVPPLATQLRIASILSAYDDLIENNRRRITLLEQAARHLYEEWFVRLKFPGHERTRIVNYVPEGWRKGSAFDAMYVMSGGTPKTTNFDFWDGDIPFYTPKDSVENFYVLDTEKHLTELGLNTCNSKLYPKDTVFITARGTVGNMNLAQKPMAMNQSCYALAGREDLTQKFLFCALRAAIQHFQQHAVGAVFDAIIVDTFKLIPFVRPELRLVHAFTEAIDPMFEKIDNLSQQNQKLRVARDLWLPRLMNGEIAT
ncbi:MAG: restriction endonuclease subunit S [bacterium]